MPSDSTTQGASDVAGCRELIVRALAEVGNETIQDVEAALATNEGIKRYDSIVLAEVLITVEAELGIVMPLDDNTAKALRSVNALAQAICDCVGAAQ